MTELLLKIEALQAEYSRERHHLSLQLLKCMQKLPSAVAVGESGGASPPPPSSQQFNIQALLGGNTTSAPTLAPTMATLNDAQLSQLIPPPPPLFPGLFPFQNSGIMAVETAPSTTNSAVQAVPPPQPLPRAPVAVSATPMVTTAAPIQIVAGPDGRQYQVVMTNEGQRFLPIQ